ncbi:uncharacterized protein, partial [Drosophila tropicalis]|uniref:uncharacterized protein n=1 Tax=Drosophila tropicalis TaxID=46794 RepID=UPI0035ABDFA2
SITTINKRQQQQQQSHQHQKYNQKLLTPTTLTTPTRFIAAKPTAVTTTTTNASTSSGVKRVNFDLPSTINETETEMENEPLLVQQQQRQANSLALASSSSSSSSLTNHSQFSLCRKPHIIFNGTYPIDMPLNNSNNYDAEANADRSELQRYRYMLHDYIIDEDAEGEEQAEAAVGYVDQEELLDYEDDEDDDDNEYVDDEDDTIDDDDYEYFVSHHNRRRTPRQRKANMYSNSDGHQSQNVWSMQELIANPSIPLNYKKMCSEVEQSLNKFEAYLDSKKQTNAVRTFDIDAPVTTAGSDGGGGGGVVGLALSSKKQL